MIITTKFDIGSKVVIEDVGLHGTIIEIIYDRSGITYNIEYWLDGLVRNVRQDEWQLLPYKNRKN